VLHVEIVHICMCVCVFVCSVLPANTTHILQPLDVGFNGALKAKYSADWISCIHDVRHLDEQLYARAARIAVAAMQSIGAPVVLKAWKKAVQYPPSRARLQLGLDRYPPPAEQQPLAPLLAHI
jgi:hypothetical protein